MQASIRQVDFYDTEVGLLNRELARHALTRATRATDDDPGIDIVAASTLMAVSATRAVSAPRATSSAMSAWTRKSANRASATPSRPHQQTRLKRRPPRPRRSVLDRDPHSGPLAPSVSASPPVAASKSRWSPSPATSRWLCWQLLITQREYAYQRPTLVARKMRALELTAGDPSRRGHRGAGNLWGAAGAAAEADRSSRRPPSRGGLSANDARLASQPPEMRRRTSRTLQPSAVGHPLASGAEHYS